MSFFYLGPATRNTCLYPEFLLRPGFSVEYCDKKLKAKKTYTRGKNSITQGSYQGFHQKICNVPSALLHNSCPMIGFYLNAQNEFLFEMKKGLKCPSDNKEKDFVRAEFLPQALTSSYCLLAAIGREIDVFCQLDLSIVKRAL